MTLNDSRLELHELLLNICPNVYYQPPASIKMTYPCIVYNLSDIDKTNASNVMYKKDHRYMLTYITKNAVDEVVDQLVELSFCVYDRYYSADNLHHHAFTIYYK